MFELPAYNLLDEKWIPVRFLDGRQDEVGLLELFEKADTIAALAETSPPNLIALYRVLLAITHRALTRAHGPWKDKDRARWYREGFPSNALRSYLEHWRERFWLLHPEFPFMQVAALAAAEETRDKLKPWTQIAIGSACGSDPLLFNHCVDDAPEPITPARACRMLLGYLQFTPGGLIKVLRISDNAGPLANTAAILPIGSVLQQTLCSALHPHSFSAAEDLPAWEQSAPSLQDLRALPALATGINDRFSRLSRAALFSRDPDGHVRRLLYAAGLALLEDVGAPDPMTSYKAGSNGLVRLAFREGRAFWRDLPSLVPDTEGRHGQPAAVLGYAANLHLILGEPDTEQNFIAAGVASDQAKLLRWRLEQVHLPVSFLKDPALGNDLRKNLLEAESLYEKLRKLSRGMYAAVIAPDPKSQEAYVRAGATLDNGPATALFFAEAERGLPRVLTLLAEGKDESAYRQWQGVCRFAARSMWNRVRQNLGQSPSALRAEAKAWPKFQAIVRAFELTQRMDGASEEAR